MSYLRARDVISGQEGKAYATIKGRVEELFNTKKFEASVNKNKAEIKTLGKRVTQYKASGAECKGSIEYYTGSMSTLFAKMMREYIKTGVDTYFDMTIVNDDPSSSIGKRTVVFYNVNIDNVDISALDVDTEGLTETMEFTFDDYEYLDEFGQPIDLAE